MSRAVLVLNAGSSSIKYALYDLDDIDQPRLKGLIDRIGLGPMHHAEGQEQALPVSSEATHAQVLNWLTEYLQQRAQGIQIVAAGHRVVHGGRDFAGPAVVDAPVRAALEQLSPLAPGHQPHNLAGIDALAQVWPDIAQVACFDTGFHRTQPRIAQLFALPRALSDEGVLRYGFHGLSYAYITSQLPKYLGARAQGRVIVLHLGHGASICAMKNGQSQATTMGFTALDGLVMGKRCGEIDPGVVLYLIREKGLSVEQAEAVLSKQSGLLGVSGISDDMRDLLASDSPDAAEAVALFCHRAATQIGAMASAIGGVDAIVFTGGMGENAAPIRARILQASAWMGVDLDARENANGADCISSSDSSVSAHVIATDEEKVIAQQTIQLLGLA